MLKSSVAKLCV